MVERSQSSASYSAPWRIAPSKKRKQAPNSTEEEQARISERERKAEKKAKTKGWMKSARRRNGLKSKQKSALENSQSIHSYPIKEFCFAIGELTWANMLEMSGS